MDTTTRQLPSTSVRRIARALIVIGFCGLVTPFILRVDSTTRVSMLLTAVAVVEAGGFIAILSRGPINSLKAKPPRYAYVVGILVAAAFIAATLLGNPGARGHLEIMLPIKLLAIGAALIAGFFEETLFRGLLMDRLKRAGRGPFLQIFISGLVFGVLHFYAFAGLQAALIAQVSTTVLGWALAGLYILSKRSLRSCVLAHTIIDAVLEPTLLLSFVH